MKDNIVKSIFNYLVNEQLDYVVLRNFEDIPEKLSMENDLDLLINKSEMHFFDKIIRSFGFELYKDKGVYLYGAQPHYHYIFTDINLHLDVVDGLYYKSPLDENCFVKIDNILQKSILEKKLEVDNFWKYRPSYEDLVTHLCCHCIFDKKQVDNKYAYIIENEYKKCSEYTLSSYLKKVFFKASNMVLECIKNRQTSMMYERYTKFKDY